MTSEHFFLKIGKICKKYFLHIWKNILCILMWATISLMWSETFLDIFPYKHVNYELDYLIRYIFFKVFWYWMNVLNVMQLSFVLLVILTLILFTGHFTIKERRRPNWRLCQRSVRPRRKKCWHFWIFCKWDHRRPRLCFLV